MPRRYGLWATLGLTAVALITGVFASLAVAIGFALGMLIIRPDTDPRVLGELLSGNGTLLSLTVVVSGGLTVAVVALFARLKKHISVREYLAWRWPGGRPLAFWCLMALLYLVVVETAGALTDADLGGDFLVDAYCSTGFPLLTWLAFVAVAPLSEEVLFRGFFLGGVADSRLGVAGAVLLSSLFWSVLHVQYAPWAVVLLVGAGVLFGVARVKTGSLIPPLAMHALWNLVAVGLMTLEAFGPGGRCG